MSIMIGSARTSHANQDAQVSMQNYYNPKQGYWYAYKPKKNSFRLSRAMFEACENNNIGYSQPQRYTLESAWQNKIQSIKFIKDKVTCDCSSLVHLCIRQAFGVNLQGVFTTYYMDKILTESGLFEPKIKVNSERQLSDGMILLSNNHTVIVINTNDLSHIIIPRPILTLGDKNEDVYYLQICLNKLMKKGLNQDGEFGTKTQLALMSFQKKQKLTQDGVYGVETKKKFKKLLYKE